jgi:hypothetical protein
LLKETIPKLSRVAVLDPKPDFSAVWQESQQPREAWAWSFIP